MKNRFAREKKDFSSLRQILLPVLSFLAIGAIFVFGFTSINQNASEERLRATERAITRAAVQCYAMEGHYPASLDYLKENYALMLDEEQYIIQYDVFASNIMPTILVWPKNFQTDDVEEFPDEAWQ